VRRPCLGYLDERRRGIRETDRTTISTIEAKEQLAQPDSGAKKPNYPGRYRLWRAVANFLWTVYRFLDANGTPVADRFDAGHETPYPGALPFPPLDPDTPTGTPAHGRSSCRRPLQIG
jgi:hypothetical protein